MAYELVDSTPLSGLGAYGGYSGLGSPAGDALGEGCLCGGSGVCTTAKLQAPAMAALRAAMREAGIPTSSGNWTTAEQNALNAFASAHGQPVSNKFLVDGGPCRALKAALATPAAPPAPVTPAGPVTSCASLLAAMPAVPPGTPIEQVLAFAQSIAPAGFDVRACVSGTSPTPTPGPVPVPGPLPSPVITPTGAGVSPVMIAAGLGAVLLLGGLAFVATRKSGGGGGKMRRNGGFARSARDDYADAQASVRKQSARAAIALQKQAAVRAKGGPKETPAALGRADAGKLTRNDLMDIMAYEGFEYWVDTFPDKGRVNLFPTQAQKRAYERAFMAALEPRMERIYREAP